MDGEAGGEGRNDELLNILTIGVTKNILIRAEEVVNDLCRVCGTGC